MRPTTRIRSIDPDNVSAAALFDRHQAIARSVARRFSRGPGVDDDLLQVARIGLLLAARRFDPDSGDFRAYATATASGEVKKYLRETGWAVHVPRQLQEDSITVARAIDRLTNQFGRNPTDEELAATTRLSTGRVRAALVAGDARYGHELTPASEGPTHVPDDEIAIVRAAVEALDDRERELIRLRFDAGLSQLEIGRRVGISQTQVHRRLASVLDRLGRRLSTAA